MNINLAMVPFILGFVTLVPAALAALVARKQKRSVGMCALVAFVLGMISMIGGWVYLAVLTLLPPATPDTPPGNAG
ncbi:hypothetical protein [Marinobacter xestospongiae]|uniref:DUF4190 domain-containing protein n=1 Tax=Marinobacter xestospongiae TaxID=994319 RepID=A0ABU3VUT4_9GAMM|nr:hypothetical protein [Marinobacter xestospongiae]MDV2078029.1 hypothetical protein [Marinobacter xestospongiae]